ncbi:hypothetical protein [Corynebacterium sanguinis]|uniref:Uncharacterized protein n=1 Tax=Corynebacterium sanguinis TaxID=2594913 RepID=A0A6C1U194_9CORY|nr:hypothetical protein [Corynebacterium sanguinis]TVS29786.1 hypothetical protein EKI59_02375 [Corynebacterium sanguinis]
MTHRATSTPRAVIGTPWWLRLLIYVIVAIVGLVLTALGIVRPEQVDSWLGQVGSLAALIGGLLAAANTGRASDMSPAEEIAANRPAQVVDTGFSSYVGE